MSTLRLKETGLQSGDKITVDFIDNQQCHATVLFLRDGEVLYHDDGDDKFLLTGFSVFTLEFAVACAGLKIRETYRDKSLRNYIVVKE